MAIIIELFDILLRILMPITPHIAHHLWQELGFGEDILEASWPRVDKKALKTATIHLVVQVNGKLRSKITVASDADNHSIEQAALNDEHIVRYLQEQKPKKIIIVPNKLVNIVV